MNLNDLASKLWPFLARLFCEVGTYTPTYQGASTGGTTTYSVQVGRYLRIFNVYLFWAYVTWTNATGTGAALISLPATTENTTNQRGTCAVYTTSVTFSGSGVEAQILPNTAYAILYSPISNTLRADVSIEAAGEVALSGVFFV